MFKRTNTRIVIPIQKHFQREKGKFEMVEVNRSLRDHRHFYLKDSKN